MSEIIIISAPSGAGKTSLVHVMVERFDNLVASISHTTRKKRDGEIDGTDYFFVQLDEFKKIEAAGKFLEHAEVFGNYYGTGIEQIEARRAEGKDVILEIDWQGARDIRARMKSVLSIFILPPSIDTLRQRLIGRGRDDKQVIDKRMSAAAAEMSHFDEYDFLVVNDDFDQACTELAGIIQQKWSNTANLVSEVALKHPKLIADISDI
jgi:guanylate kinase